jgi:hypothetical protein
MAYNLPLGSVGVATSPEPGVYPYIHGQQTEAGHMFILDDTPENEQIILQHAKSNTQVWIEPDGSMQTTISGNNFTVVVNNNNVVVKGVCNINIEADAKLTVNGDVYAQMRSLTAVVKKGPDNTTSTYGAMIGGDCKIFAEGNVDLSSGGDINITAGASGEAINPVTAPNIYLNTGNSVVVNGDLTVAGGLRVGNSITSGENISAGYKLFAYGGIETLGGLNVGFTLPGSILPSGVVVALTSVSAPTFNGAFGNIGIMNTIYTRDVFGSLSKLRVTYNRHIHNTPRGPSGSPIYPDTGEGAAATKPGFTPPLLSA